MGLAPAPFAVLAAETLEAEMQERRRHRRYTFDGSVTYRRLGPDTTGRIRNLSEGGLLVELPELLSPGTQLDLVISVDDRSVHAEAEVAWAQELPTTPAGSYRHGVKFTRFELQDRLTWAVFIAKAFGE
jgi:hypothetical protein